MKVNLPIILCAGLLILGVGCKSTGPRFDPYLLPGQLPGGYDSNVVFTTLQSTNQVDPDLLAPPEDFYRLGPGDVIDIEVVGDPQSPASVLVGPDGKAYYSILPGMLVWGLTLAETTELLETSLEEYILVRPEVSVTLRTVASQRIWILGNVQQPGVYLLDIPRTILEAVSGAGGVVTIAGNSQELGDLANSFIMRDGQLLPIDMERLFHLGDLSQNIYLQPGDYIYIRPAVAREIYVLGAVLYPNVVPHGAKASVVSAIASVGGPVRYAYLQRVAVIRGSISNPSIAIVNYQAMIKGKAPDVHLQPGDIVYVPFVPWQKLLQFGEVILNEFVRTVALNEGIRAGGGTGTVNVSVSGGNPATPAPPTPASTSQ
jgi:protein involved in polysaccharide export with SLBB domain